MKDNRYEFQTFATRLVSSGSGDNRLQRPQIHTYFIDPERITNDDGLDGV